MHMADALISPAVGGTMWAASVGLAAFSVRRIQSGQDDRKVPLMGVLGAFIFAAQMINFAIPGTGSSGHLAGGLILAALLGPEASFITIASVLAIQALFFGDGGLLAWGCNVFNLGFFPCFLAYPLVFKPLLGKERTSGRLLAGSLLAAIVGLELAALGVVIETVLSGISELPFPTFLLLMLPIHLAIGAVEGFISAAVISFIWEARPELAPGTVSGVSGKRSWSGSLVVVLLILAILVSGVLSRFASPAPDGLEWSIFYATGKAELKAPDGLHRWLAVIQGKTAFFPDYVMKKVTRAPSKQVEPVAAGNGISVPGMVGAVLTLGLVTLIGFGLRYLKRRNR